MDQVSPTVQQVDHTGAVPVLRHLLLVNLMPIKVTLKAARPPKRVNRWNSGSKSVGEPAIKLCG
jgi:hypothetical protein